jgi:hypothetical protein
VPRPATNGSRPCEMGEHRRGEVRARCAHALPTRFARWQWHPGWEPVPPYNAAMPETSPRQPARRWKRTIRGAAAALLLLAGGAVVNVAVAWGFALWSTPEPAYELERSNAVELIERRGATVDPEDNIMAGVLSAPGLTLTSLALDASHRSGVSLWCLVTSAGFPCRSFMGDWRGHGTDLEEIVANFHIVGAIEVPASWRPHHTFPWLFPYRAIWHGFAINNVVYATILWLLFFAPFAARRMLRRRRGLCEKCAYPIGVSAVCTECGAAVPCSMKASQT